MAELRIPFGKYRLLKKLARGGMAEIFLASQAGVPPSERLVVIKRVLRGMSDSPDFVKMFLDEARIVARLHHPQIVRIFDLGQIDGQFYIAMEYIAGEDQRTVFDQAIAQKVQLPLGYIAEVILGAAEALASAHQLKDAEGRPLRLVHRDVTPSNLLATWQGSVKLVDFGIARTDANSSKTDAGTVKGKVRYLSPEQCRNQRVDHRSDLYALGVVFYELVTLNKAFSRDSPFVTVKAILGGEVPPLEEARADISPELSGVVKRAMAVDPARRYQSGAELAADLTGFLAGAEWERGVDSVDFLTSMFGDARKQAKLRLATGLPLNDQGYAAMDTVKPQPRHVRPRPLGLPIPPPPTVTTDTLRPRALVRVALGSPEPSGLAATLDTSNPKQGDLDEKEDISTEPTRRRPDEFPLDAASELDGLGEEPKTIPMATGLLPFKDQTTPQMRPSADDLEPATKLSLPPVLGPGPATSGAALAPVTRPPLGEGAPQKTTVDEQPTAGVQADDPPQRK